jgi:hypothetical protein
MFVQKLVSRQNYVVRYLLPILTIIACALPLLAFAVPQFIDTTSPESKYSSYKAYKSYLSYVSVAEILGPLLGLYFFLSGLICLALARSTFRIAAGTLPRNYLVEDLPRGIIARKATSAKDMIFGVYSILERIIEHEMPAPDHSRTVEELYSDLTTRLLPIYGTPLLTIAAMKSVSGQPSWVIDWSHTYPELEVYLPHSSRDLDDRAFNLQDSAIMWGSSVGHDLKVRGCHLGTITSIHGFQAMENTYHNSYLEHHRETHLENLEELLIFMNHFEIGQVDLPGLLHTIFPDVLPSAFDGSISSHRRLKTWTNFIFTRRDQSATSIFHALRNTRWDFWRYLRFHFFTSGPPTWFHYEPLTRKKLLRVHMAVLQYLATSNQKLFWCTLNTPLRVNAPEKSGQPFATTRVFGICCGDVEDGDTITWLDRDEPKDSKDYKFFRRPGSCFITRNEGQGSVLISPAMIAPRVRIGEGWDGAADALEMIDLY